MYTEGLDFCLIVTMNNSATAFHLQIAHLAKSSMFQI